MTKTILALLFLVFSAHCLACQQGYVTNPVNSCIEPRYIEGCNQYLSETVCKACDFRYVLQPNGLCGLDTESTEDCCLSRAGDGSCSKCQTGLYLINGKCQQSNVIGCLEKDGRGICINCASDYFLNAGSCLKTVKDCYEFADQNRTVCVSCRQGFSLYNNYCVENSILGCKKEVDHVCQQCYPLFTLKDGHCIINNCKAYNDYSCVACQCGYYLTTEGKCKKVEPGCVRYQRGQCTDCLINFTLKGTECSIEGCDQMQDNNLRCKTCSASYDKVNGGCVLKNCLIWKDGTCKVCQQGYTLETNGCVKVGSLSTE